MRPQLWVLFIVSFLAGAAMGFFALLLSELARERSYGDVDLGLVSSAYYLLVVVGSACAVRLAPWHGVRRLLVVGLTLGAVAAVLSPLAPRVFGLAAVRALGGLGAGLQITAAHAALLAQASPANRGKVLGISALAFGVGLGAGPFVGPHLYAYSPPFAFTCGGVLLAFGAVLVSIFVEDVKVTPVRATLDVARRLVVPIHAVFVYGFAEAAILSLYPFFLLRQGLSPAQMGYACSAFVLGSLAGMLPITALSDRVGRRRVLAWCLFGGSLLTCALARVADFHAVFGLSLVAGMLVGPIYALSYALAGDVLDVREAPSGAAGLTSAFAIGCIAGPVVTSLVVERFGHGALFAPTIVLFASFAVHAWPLRRGSDSIRAMLESTSAAPSLQNIDVTKKVEP
ncbi:MFS transporter [Pendulispora brunnea]|uniref:MFS transporter n=1 Tax=Pendulispora brunnea TaxID=2905690 RepID=A0ABZ2KTA8_9BACT